MAQPWERQPYETPGAWAMFQFYLEQDPPRSLVEAYRQWRRRRGKEDARPVRQAPGGWNNLAAGKTRRGALIVGGLTWAARAAAWEDHLAAEERQKWAIRRAEIKEREYDIAQRLMQRAEEMLMFPVMIQESADGKTVIMPADWRIRDIPAVADAASKLARLAAEMSTARVEIDWREEARKAGIDDPEDLYRQAVRHFEQQLERKNVAGSLASGTEESGEGQE